MTYFNFVKSGEESDMLSTLVLGGCSIFLAVVCYSVAGDNISGIQPLLVGYLGYSAYVLVPMTIILLAIVIQIMTMGRLELDSPWCRVVVRIETLAPVIGILGTFISIGLGLSDLTPDQLNSNGILGIASQIGAAVWNSVVGLVLGMVAYIVGRDGIKEPEEEETVASISPGGAVTPRSRPSAHNKRIVSKEKSIS